MTRETSVSLSPEDVLDFAAEFFTGVDSGYSGTVVEKGPDYIRIRSFRGNMAIWATREGERTRVRCSTLRYHPSVGKFLSRLQQEAPASRT